jgi:hypothetical protein
MPEGTYTIAFDTLFPPPGMESFISTPRTPTISQVVDQEVVEGEARQQSIVGQIVDSGRIPTGAKLVFQPPYKISGSDLLQEWLKQNPEKHAVWQQNSRHPLLWEGEPYSPTGLAKQIIREATGNQRSLRGPEWWTYGGQNVSRTCRSMNCDVRFVSA